jgi:hypothetical protein
MKYRSVLFSVVLAIAVSAAHIEGCASGASPDPFILCGNGTLDSGEQCDAGDKNSDTGDCLTTCVKATCGDGFVNAGKEQCDGHNLLGTVCANLGFGSGTLSCNAACQFDTSGCGAAFTPTVVLPTFTQAPTYTPTPGSACGNGLIEPGETCANCPADCMVRACTATTPTQTFTVSFTVPPAQDVSSITVVVGYRTDFLSIPGSGTASTVGSRVKNKPSNAIVGINDLDYALRVVVTRSNPIPVGRLFTVDFDSCAGAAVPTVVDVACTVEGCATSFGAVEGCSCAVTLP